MKQFYMFADGDLVGIYDTKECAVELLRLLQRLWMGQPKPKRPKFSIVEGEVEFIPYPDEEKGGEDEKNG